MVSNCLSMPNFSGGLAKPPLKSWHGCVITIPFHRKLSWLDIITYPRPKIGYSLFLKGVTDLKFNYQKSIHIPCIRINYSRYHQHTLYLSGLPQGHVFPLYVSPHTDPPPDLIRITRDPCLTSRLSGFIGHKTNTKPPITNTIRRAFC